MESSQGFNCDQYDRNFKTDHGMKIPAGKAHNSEDEPENVRDYGKRQVFGTFPACRKQR